MLGDVNTRTRLCDFDCVEVPCFSRDLHGLFVLGLSRLKVDCRHQNSVFGGLDPSWQTTHLCPTEAKTPTRA